MAELAPEGARRAALYARKSNEDARNPGKSVSDQLRQARAEADRRGYVVEESLVFADDGISASRHARRKARPGFAALLAAIEEGRVDVVLMAEQSRATRRLAVVGALMETCADHGVTLVLGGREVDPADPADIVLTAVQGGMDHAESERSRIRILRGVRGAADRGRPHGKNVYGYRRIYDEVTRELLVVEPEPDEARVIQELARRVLAGESLRSICHDLDDREVPTPYDAVAMRQGRTPRGAKWIGSTIGRILTNPVYVGRRRHRDRIVEGEWEAILSERDFDRLGAIFRAPERRSKAERPGALVHYLSGVARCGECGSAMRVLTNRGRYRTYVCMQRGCHKVSRTAGPLEEYVRDVILALVARPDFLSLAAAMSEDTSPLQAALAEVEELTARRDKVRDLITSGSLPPEDGALMLRELASRLEDAQRQARDVALPRSVADLVPADLGERWDELEPGQQREVALALVDVVVLSMEGRKAHVFDPSTVRVTPRWEAS